MIHSVSLEVHSIANALPQQNEDDDSPLVGLALKSTNGLMSSVTQGAMHTQSSIDAEAVVLLEDAKKRNIVWDAEMKLDHAQTNSGSDNLQKYPTHPTDFNSEGLLGQRVEDGSVLPIGRYISGKEAAEVSHVGQLVATIPFFVNNVVRYAKSSLCPCSRYRRPSMILKTHK